MKDQYSRDLADFNKGRIFKLAKDADKPIPQSCIVKNETFTEMRIDTIASGYVRFQDGVVGGGLFNRKNRISGSTFERQAILVHEMSKTLAVWFDEHPFKNWLRDRMELDFRHHKHEFWLATFVDLYFNGYGDVSKYDNHDMQIDFEVNMLEGSLSSVPKTPKSEEDVYSIRLECRICAETYKIEACVKLPISLLDCYSKDTIAKSIKAWEEWYQQICRENMLNISSKIIELKAMIGICEGL